MNLTLLEKLWFAAGLAFIAYPIGDILGFWDIKPVVVLLASSLLLLTGWDVGKRGRAR